MAQPHALPKLVASGAQVKVRWAGQGDCVRVIYRLLKSDKRQTRFVSWIKLNAELTDGEVVAIDGKLF